MPWIMKLPGGQRGGARVTGAAGLVDVAPTLLALAGAPADGMDGRSLVPALTSRRVPDQTVYSETRTPTPLRLGRSRVGGRRSLPLHSIGDAGAVRCRRRSRGTPQPGARQGNNRVCPLRMARSHDAGGGGGAAGAGGRGRPGASTRPGLRRFVAEAAGAGATAPNPKDKITIYETLRSAQRLAAAGRDQEVIVSLEPLRRASRTCSTRGN